MFMSGSNVLILKNFFNAIGKYPISLVFCGAIFNACRVTGHLQTTD